MDIEWEMIETRFQGGKCFTHARGVVLPDGEIFITTQPLLLSGSDVFYEIHTIRKSPEGSWSEILPSKNLVRKQLAENVEQALCDGTPFYHRKTGKLLILGHTATYMDNKHTSAYPRKTAWSIFDFQTNDWAPYETLDMGDENTYFSAGNGSGQSLELPDGDILIPYYYMEKDADPDPWKRCYKSSVMRCAFDGKSFTIKELGEPLTVDCPRGLCEPSIVEFCGKYFLALRNDKNGYIARGEDGLHFEEPHLLVFDDGAEAGNYCTQQHWIVCGGKLYLVYTRKNANNDHVFRHRAPLFIAEYDGEKMCLMRSTEKIAVPERGARLGNFGCARMNDNESLVIASEWMQPNWENCMKYGSKNTIFVSKISCGGKGKE